MLKYDAGIGEWNNWVVTETGFDPAHQGKGEAVLSLGNGYMGLRSATDESYVGQVRNWFVAGTFNKFDEHEVTELPNAADVTELAITLNGVTFNLEKGRTISYSRQLNLKNGELTRNVVWQSPTGESFELQFRRFVSLSNRHLVGSSVTIKPLDGQARVHIASGINGQWTNSGAQHFTEGEKRIFEKTYIQMTSTTTQSAVDFVTNTVHNWQLNGAKVEPELRQTMGRRKVGIEGTVTVEAGQSVTLEKISNVHTSRDLVYNNSEYSLEKMRESALTELKQESQKGYDQLFRESANAWANTWSTYNIEVDSTSGYDQLAIRFAIYHLVIMTPAHDNRMGIGAKGLSGEGYKGHSFWDTEIFILPFFIYSNPQIARSLLEYRYQGLDGARSKAKENGFEGAMYPWEAAWIEDGEVTPVWGDVDIVTGEQTKIWSGFIEQHITSDIAYAVWHYVQSTGDEAFMDQYGYEIIFDTATFWASRLEWDEAKGRYHINEVVGPDEYKEHVDNNAFTNHMAHFNMELAIQYYEKLQQEKPELLKALSGKLDLTSAREAWNKLDQMYLPGPNEQGLIPQDDTYLQKKVIDLTPYKNQTKVASIFNDYNLDQVGEMQISKQADIMMLFFLLENKFEPAIKRANYDYYEEKTLHDSSLSLSTHSILASDFGNRPLAYDLFRRASEIDLGPHMHSSDAGIHSASLGGIWECVVMGFAGVRMLDGQLHLDPKLPESWSRLKFPLYWHNQLLHITITPEGILIESDAEEEISLLLSGQQVTFSKRFQTLV
ncbi:glycoside hydrolase family 65 protein [Paenibacillus sp. JNUCC31]|uniref:glycoside hydrolase family 65 protein n=1 Tax=Paenibacillus sp. JNUCC-31 TaxID=2777983 RepID=UPI00177EA717|nr:glycoside hydrolase family 65 protein [Paenibacillus sp. JNUCC-31]QOS81150.1 glycoside hydrolase family 65 protein [Paenibacillus sp. JNUCC-31]